MRHGSALRLAFLLLVLCGNTGWAMCPQSSQAKFHYDDWLTIEGGQVKYKVRVNLFLPNGQPISDFEGFVFDQYGKPVSNAVLIGEDTTTDKNGVAFIDLPEGQPFFRCMVSTPNGDVGMIDAVGPFGNTGFPVGYDGNRHFRTMLKTSVNR